MSKATGIYAIMILVFGAGLWAILSVGSRSQAQEDLSGTWALWPVDAPRGENDSADQTMSIEQSGRFFNIIIMNQQMSMKLVEHVPAGQAGGPRRVKIANESWVLIGQGIVGGDEMTVELIGPSRRTVWHAVRTWRKYSVPGQSPAAPEIRPTTAHAHG